MTKTRLKNLNKWTWNLKRVGLYAEVKHYTHCSFCMQLCRLLPGCMSTSAGASEHSTSWDIPLQPALNRKNLPLGRSWDYPVKVEKCFHISSSWCNNMTASHADWFTSSCSTPELFNKARDLHWAELSHSCPRHLTPYFSHILPPLTPADRQRLWVGALLDELVAALHHALQLSLITGDTEEAG